jgi:hypothetical protein
MRLACVGSLNTTLTTIPTFKSPIVAFCPLTVISLIGDTVRVLVVGPSRIVTVLAVTPVMTVCEAVAAGAALLLPPRLPRANDGTAKLPKSISPTITQTKFRVFMNLFLIHRDGRNRRLERHFPLFLFLSRIDRLARWINQARRDEDDQVPFDVLIDVRTKQATDQG